MGYRISRPISHMKTTIELPEELFLQAKRSLKADCATR